MDIAGWLRSLSLQDYEQAFNDNAIDIDILPDLTDSDLEKMGVRLGHRKRMLNAIAALPRTPSAQPALAAHGRPPDAAELRQLTVMFVDIIGSTELGIRTDPEDYRELIVAYHRRIAEIVTRFKGFVSRYMGDGVLAFFGYPQAHESDVERAVRAGLAIVQDTALLADQKRPPLRVGIETGMVIVGYVTGEGEARERGVIGETANLAARLESIAEPDTVVIGPGTRRLLGSLFELRELGALSLRGLPDPVQAYRVLGLAPGENRFEAFHSAETLAPMIGREDDLQTLLRRWDRARAGEGQIVLLSGEPGIGKSRLTASLLAGLSHETHARQRYFCSPHHADSALYPFISQLERAAGFERGDTPDDRLDKLDALLAEAGIAGEDAGLIAELLSLPAAGRYPVPDLTPQRRRNRTLEALLTHLEGLAAQRPVLLVLEDAHWADPSSIELLERVVARLRHLQVMALITYRPEFVAPWVGQPHVTTIMLSRLPPDKSAELILRTIGKAAVDPNTVNEIVAHADGVPLFAEELTKAILEVGSTAARQVAAILGRSTTVPPTLFASLMARLDRLDPGKEIAQIGAAIGREFSYELLATVAGTPEPVLQEALDQLIDAGLIFSRGVPPEARYLFKHALVQDVAYGTLLRRPRQKLHGRIADALRQRMPETLEAQPELHAYHLMCAGNATAAVRFWLKAGERAAGQSANKEAITHLRNGIDCLAELPDSADRLRLEIDLNSALVAVLQVMHGYGSDIVGTTVNRVLELCRQTDDPALMAPVLFQAWLFNQMRANYPDGAPLADELLALVEGGDDPEAMMAAHFANGLTKFALGEPVDSHRHFAAGARIHNTQELGRTSFRYGFAAGPADHAYAALTQAMIGYPEQALVAAHKAAAIIGQTRHPYTMARGLVWCAFVALTCQDWRTAYEWGDRAVVTAYEQGFEMPAASGLVARGVAKAMLEPDAPPPEEIRSGLARYQQTGGRTQTQMPFLLTLLAEVALARGDWDSGLHALSEANAWMAETGERQVEAEAQRLLGDLLAASGRGDPEPPLLRALAVARAQQARLFELRAASSLARLYHRQDRPDKARAVLRPVYDWFTEGFGMPDLTDARRRLERFAIR